MAEEIRATGAKGGNVSPNVTEVPKESLGRDGSPRHADAIALGEADYTWPRIVADAERGELDEVYLPINPEGKEVKPSLADYPRIPWDTIDLSQFDLIGHVPAWLRSIMRKMGNP